MSRFHKLKVKDVLRLTPQSVALKLDVPANMQKDFTFLPGQYLTVRANIAGDVLQRSYSICSGLDDGEVCIAVKQIDGGLFSSYANENLQVGDELDVSAPDGRFCLKLCPEASKTYVCVAAGSGITPILSIVKSVLMREANAQVVLLFGNRNTGSIMFKDTLEDLKDKYMGRLSVHHVLSREGQEVELLHGRLDAMRIEKLVKASVGEAKIDDVFLCGPLEMVECAAQTLSQMGVSPSAIHKELFTPGEGKHGVAKPKVDLAGQRTALQITLDGSEHSLELFEGETVLEAAERAGLDVPSSCRGGMCCTCRAKVTGGAVEMDVNYSLQPWEVEAGFVLTCQSRAKGEAKISVDFDAV